MYETARLSSSIRTVCAEFAIVTATNTEVAVFPAASLGCGGQLASRRRRTVFRRRQALWRLRRQADAVEPELDSGDADIVRRARRDCDRPPTLAPDAET
jgi:hypothetical protein